MATYTIRHSDIPSVDPLTSRSSCEFPPWSPPELPPGLAESSRVFAAPANQGRPVVSIIRGDGDPSN